MDNDTHYCTIFPDNPGHCDAVVAVRRVTASISVLGCLFIIAVIWLYRKYAAFAQRLILYLSIAAFLDCTAYLMGELHPDGPLCDFQAFWLTYFDWSVLLWVSCITLNLSLNVVKMISTEKYEKIYHAVCWLVPMFFAVLPFINDNYGPAGAWCWIKDDIGWRLGIWYVPLFVIIACMVVAYIYIIYTIRKRASRWEGTFDPDVELSHEGMKEDIKQLRVYPFIYFAVSIIPLINRIQNAVHPGQHVFVLLLLSAVSSPLHGALNALVFGVDKETARTLRPMQLKVALLNRFRRHDIHDLPKPPLQGMTPNIPDVILAQVEKQMAIQSRFSRRPVMGEYRVDERSTDHTEDEPIGRAPIY